MFNGKIVLFKNWFLYKLITNISIDVPVYICVISQSISKHVPGTYYVPAFAPVNSSRQTRFCDFGICWATFFTISYSKILHRPV